MPLVDMRQWLRQAGRLRPAVAPIAIAIGTAIPVHRPIGQKKRASRELQRLIQPLLRLIHLAEVTEGERQGARVAELFGQACRFLQRPRRSEDEWVMEVGEGREQPTIQQTDIHEPD